MRERFFHVIAFAILLLQACALSHDAAAALRTVPDPAERRLVLTRAGASGPPRQTTCGEPPPPVHDLALDPVYRRNDPTQSRVDSKASAAYRNGVASIRTFVDETNHLADSYLGVTPRDGRIAQCLARWLAQWAREDSLLGGLVSKQGNAERKWTLASAAINYALLADAPEVGAEQRGFIESWLKRLAEAWIAGPDYGLERPNNHLNWGALAMMAAGAATQDAGLFEEGLKLARQALAEIAQDGSSPHELARGSRAIDYHIFALEPLIVTSEIAAANGIDLDAEQNGALHRLARFTLDAMLDPDPVTRRVGVAQDWRGRGTRQPNSAAWGWAQVYAARHRDPQVDEILRKLRGSNFRHAWLGDLALRFGPPEIPLPAARGAPPVPLARREPSRPDPSTMRSDASTLRIGGKDFPVGFRGGELKTAAEASDIDGVTFDGNTIRIEKDGVVLDGFDLRNANVVVKADHVTIRNSLGGATGWYSIDQYEGYSGLTVEFCTFDGLKSEGDNPTGTNGTIIMGRDGPMTIRNSRFFDVPSDVINTAGGTIEHNYIAGGGYQTDSHADAISVHKTTGGPLVIRENYIDFVTPKDAGVAVTNSAIKIIPHFGEVDDVTVESNVLLGGGYTIYAVNAEHPARNVRIVGNDIGLGKWGVLYPGGTRPAGFLFDNNIDVASGARLATIGTTVVPGPRSGARNP